MGSELSAYCCKSCLQLVRFLAGFAACECGVKPIQLILPLLDPQPEDYITFLEQHKTFAVKKSQEAFQYLKQTQKFLQNSPYNHLISNIPPDLLPWTVGLGDPKSFAAALKGQSQPIRPKHLIITKTVPGYITGVWFIGRRRIRSISWHPFGQAFFHLIYQQVTADKPFLLFQDLLNALKLINRNLETHTLVPILAHPQLSIAGLHLWAPNPAIAIIEEENLTTLQQLKKLSLPYVVRSWLKSWHGPSLLFQVNKLQKRPATSYPLVMLPKTPPIIVDFNQQIWRHAKTGEILAQIPFVLTHILHYETKTIYRGYLEYGGRRVDVGFDSPSLALRWIQFACASEQIPCFVHKRISPYFMSILMDLYKTSCTQAVEPLFGYHAQLKEIFLPYVSFRDEIRQNYFYLSDYPFGWVPIRALSSPEILSLQFNPFLRWLRNILEAVLEGKSQQWLLYCPRQEVAERVLAKFWITKIRADHTNWPALGREIVITEDKKAPHFCLEDFPFSLPPFNLKLLMSSH